MSKAYLIDLDGTIYKGTQLCDGATEFISFLLKSEIPFVFFTNNSSRTAKQAKEHMLALGLSGIENRHFFTSAMAASRHMAKTSSKRRAFVVGELGLMEALQEQGFELVEDHADIVFVGLNKAGNYALHSEALKEIMAGAVLVGTNNDRRILLEDGPSLGNGAIVNMLEYASGKKAIEIGKPHAPMIEEALAYLQKDRQDCIIVGDNLETDILCGINHGVETILVLGGIHDASDCVDMGIKPTRVVDSLHELVKK